MQVIHGFDGTKKLVDKATVTTIGSYDGVHRGHKHIIKKLQESAVESDFQTALVTFHPHPKAVLVPNTSVSYLTTLEEKLIILEKLGLDMVMVIPFTPDLAQTSARTFMERLVDTLELKELWTGVDFTLGRAREGDVPYLSQLGSDLGYRLNVVAFETESNLKISSSALRSLIETGRVALAADLLGHYHFLKGQVIQGAQRGRTIGFPTANIAVAGDKLLAANGVYAVWIYVQGQAYPAVANIGVRPTFDEQEKTIEVHIFDFEADIYEEMVVVEFADYIRPEQKFEGLSQLVAQIHRDVDNAKDILSRAQGSHIVA